MEAKQRSVWIDTSFDENKPQAGSGVLGNASVTDCEKHGNRHNLVECD